MESLQLIESNPDPVRSAVMSRAGELRAEGYDKSDALATAWDDILGEDYGLEDEDEDIYPDEILAKKPTTRRGNPMTTSNPDGGIGLLALVGGLSYLLWCAIAYKRNGAWTWTPWKTEPVGRRIAPTRRLIGSVEPIPGNNHAAETVTLIVP